MCSYQLRILTFLIASLLVACQQDDEPEAAFPLVINEFMCSNKACSAADESGDCDDWIELYNSGRQPVVLGGIGCSDDSTDLFRYAIPDTTLDAGEYLVIWADGEPEEGPLHASFKLSSENGDEIILTSKRGIIVDRIQFFAHSGNPVARVPDASYGREFDGSDNWVQLFSPSPGAQNNGGRR